LKRGPLLVALFLAALTLRPQLVGVGPLLPSIQSDLGVSHAVAGLLGTIPVLCMGLFAPPAPFLSGRIGSRRAIGLALALIGVFGVARALVPGAIGLIVMTFPIGIAMGLGNALLPVAVKERFSDRPSFATGVYATGIAAGATIAVAVAVPLAHLAGGWRTPLLAIGAVSTALGVLWLWLTRTEPAHVRTEIRPLKLPWRNPLGWQLVAAFSLMSFVFYGLSSWLPDAYVEHGWSESSAGALLAVLSAVAMPVGFAVAWAADHVGTRRRWLVGLCTLQLAALLGIVLLPGAGWLWAVMLGMSIGPLFPLTLTLPVDAGEGPAEVAALAGMMLGVGYVVASTGPLLLGVVRDLTGGFNAVLWTLAAVSALVLLVDTSLSPARLAAHRSSA
jgi:MFS transporter, CP family, cyanate transporter